MHRSRGRIQTVVLGALAAASLAIPGGASAADGSIRSMGDRIELSSVGSSGHLDLRVTGPSDFVLDRRFGSGEPVEISLVRSDGSSLADGEYSWEIRGVAPARVRSEDESGGAARDAEAPGVLAQGAFAVRDGAVVTADLVERSGNAPRLTELDAPTLAPFDFVIADDLIVQGSACVGLDCVNNESFGFDTIRLKENNLRIAFMDTSVSPFPTNDWQLVANDSASGGQNRFSIEDVTGARTPLTVVAGATTNSIFVDSTGRVGFKTSTPVLDLHINDSDTPALRMEQNSSGGFTAQTWDVAGNEANFFVRDVTGGSLLSFRIRPGAPTSSLDISADGDVGIGTGSPDEKLHVQGADGTNAILVEETSGTMQARNMLTMRNNGAVQMLFDRTDGTSNDWQIQNFGATFRLSVPGAATPQFSLAGSGNLTISGTLTQLSSRTAKENFVPADPAAVLDRLVSLPIASWNMRSDPQERHLGPFAEDWFAAFGLGPDSTHISVSDLSGVALVAIQGLHAELREKQAELERQDQRLRQLEAANAKLFALVEALGIERPATP